MRRKYNKDGFIKLTEVAEALIEKQAPTTLNKGLRLQSAWESVADGCVLEHTDNIVFSPKAKQPTLLVYVDSSAWAADLSMKKELYKLLLIQELGQNIEDILFLVSRKVALKKAFTKREVQNPSYIEDVPSIPLTQEEQGHARELVEGVSDNELKTRLYNAMTRDMEWKKGIVGKKEPQEPR